ncbi:MAG: protoporphyrinogen oxidase [Candidatus Omnitrophica bacterium CG11_big_fil_rev_8_21_14_0_20_45_26]|uniref:Coproporphyrinogen III oxidase n=1 Tax=Candidatus Abzuiibacterium crystallinum TaxID=1974748 RepID=A0A2H0LNV3_9BACT|nr:MAG: protoporphyrinogen oxidase [Candidatus Omnitrophica bacterium CG11_big_fil_rev_8_21_14_0_20_45_26]PIW65666.1 MAG: protoporphyrinogen oxidase [Candidatus Omnitrophica bacterium CG12_big_fil_rev_8_21_14_0_65_45_16]
MTPKKIAIIGAGISGLACAYRLQELQAKEKVPLEIHLFEAGQRLGGVIQTVKRDGFLLEGGPDAFISDQPWGLKLIERLGLTSEIVNTSPENRQSFVAKGNRLIPLPKGFYLIAPTHFTSFLLSSLVSWQGKIRMMYECFIPPSDQAADESVGSFVRRRFGQEALDRIAQPMLAGIYTGDPDRLSLRATVSRFLKLEKDYGSVIRGLLASKIVKKKNPVTDASGPRYSLFLSFKRGMQTLTDALINQLNQTQVHLKTRVQSLTYSRSKDLFTLHTEADGLLAFDAVCLALPAYQSAKILANELPEVSQWLSQIKYESVATINFAFERKDCRHRLNGFGFVVPRVENKSLVACSFSSNKFAHRAPEDKILLRAFVGGAFGRHVFEYDDETLARKAFADLSVWLKIDAKPLFAQITRYPRTMVQYEVGHRALVDQIMNRTDGCAGSAGRLCLTGSAYPGVGIPQCIHDAELKAESMFECLYQKKESLQNQLI